MCFLVLGGSSASALHTWDQVNAIVNETRGIVVTSDGSMPPIDLPGETVLFSKEEWVGPFEHESDPLAEERYDGPDFHPQPPLDAGGDPGTDSHNEGPTGKAVLDPNSGVVVFEFWVYLIPAIDGGHRPANLCNIEMSDRGLDQFNLQISAGIVPKWACIMHPSCEWDAGGSGFNMQTLMFDLEFALAIQTGCHTLRDENHELVLGWVSEGQHNGIFPADTWVGVAAESCIDPGVNICSDWEEDEIVQHEISHAWSAPDRGVWPWDGSGVMNEFYAWWGNYEDPVPWTSADEDIIYNNVLGCSCGGPHT